MPHMFSAKAARKARLVAKQRATKPKTHKKPRAAPVAVAAPTSFVPAPTAADEAANRAQDEARGTAPKAGRRTRRRTSKTIRMKKSAYLREHHHLFRVLQNPTRRALNAELRDQKRELARRGLKE